MPGPPHGAKVAERDRVESSAGSVPSDPVESRHGTSFEVRRLERVRGRRRIPVRRVTMMLVIKRAYAPIKNNEKQCVPSAFITLQFEVGTRLKLEYITGYV